MIYPSENIVYTGHDPADFSYEKPMGYRERCATVIINSFDKILPIENK
jgi:hypothetical protein